MIVLPWLRFFFGCALLLLIATASPGGEPGGFPPGMKSAGEPTEVDIRWTAYFIAPVEGAPEGKGREISFTSRVGKKIQYFLSGESFQRAEVEAVAVGVDKKGNKRFAWREDEGIWTELPEGSMGMGNRVNPLVPLVHVAADQSKFPYGSMVYVPEAEGHEFVPGKRMSGYFWVGDVGSLVAGDHMDLFVGEEEVYSGFVDQVKKPLKKTKVYKLPKLDEEYNPGLQSGLSKILHLAGYLEKEEDVPVEEIDAALLKFQKDQTFIPPSEYGQARAATTLWFLTQVVTSKPEEKE